MPVTEFRCEVKSFRMITKAVFETTFVTDKPFAFEAGQFISIVIPGAGPKGRDLRRAYSLASGPEDPTPELCVKLVEEGPGTHYLYRLRPGEVFRGFAPYGDFVYEPKADRDVYFIATGTGVAPFRSMVRSKAFLKQPPRSTTVLLGVSHEDELLYDAEFAGMSAIRWIPAVSRAGAAWQGFRGRVTDYLRQHLNEISWPEAEFYLCGNGAMIDEVKALLVARGVAKDSIHQEIYYKPPKQKAEPAPVRPAEPSSGR